MKEAETVYKRETLSCEWFKLKVKKQYPGLNLGYTRNPSNVAWLMELEGYNEDGYPEAWLLVCLKRWGHGNEKFPHTVKSFLLVLPQMMWNSLQG